MTGVADEDYLAPLARVSLHLHVYLGDEGARGIEHGQAPLLRLVLHGVRDAMRGEDDRRAGRHLLQLLDEDGAEIAQPIDDVAVVNHLVTHVDGGSEELDRPFHDLDGAVHAGAEAARVGEKHLHQTFSFFELRLSSQASMSNSTAPTVMAESATLNAHGKYVPCQCARMKSTTCPMRNLSIKLPSAPPRISVRLRHSSRCRRPLRRLSQSTIAAPTATARPANNHFC